MKIVLGVVVIYWGILSGFIFFPSGNKFGQTVEKVSAREPFEVVDTLHLSAGVGRIIFNSHFTSTKSNVLPTSKGNIFPSITQILSDTSDAVNYYAVYISNNLETLIVKSSLTSDSSDVRIRLLMR